MRTVIKLISFVAAFLLCLSLAACGGDEVVSSEGEVSSEISSEEESKEPEIKYEVNPLTGLATLTAEEVALRPVAVSVSNIKVAQTIQTGVGNADIVFETVTEGGITRLLALYKAPKEETGKIGSIRSARVVFAELAASFNAIYIHHGMDEVYCRPRVNELKIPRIEVSQKNYGDRLQNGKSWEHRLYTSGAQLKEAIAAKGYNKGGESDPWVYFSENKTAEPTSAKTVNVKFNNSYITNFYYNEDTKNYTRGVRGEVIHDYFTKQDERFTNVFVLETYTAPYPDDYHTEVELNSGSGYYVTQGGYEEITWSKKGNNKPITFKDKNGNTLSVTPGNSYVCLVNKNHTDNFTAE